MRTFAKLLVDEPILSCQRLDVLCKFSYLLRFKLGQLSLLFKLLPKILAFAPQMLNFLLSLEKFTLVVILFAGCDAHLVLDVAEIEALFLHLLLD